MKGEKRTILVVDGNREARSKMVSALRDRGFEVNESSNVRQAIETFWEHKPSVVITDCTVPQISEELLIEQVREIDPAIPVLLITEDVPDNMLLDLLRFDRFAAIHKPFSIEVLNDALEQIFNWPSPDANFRSRRANRVDVSIPISVQSHGNGTVLNLSIFGLYAEMLETVPVGSEIKLSLDLEDRIEIGAEVVWSNNPGDTNSRSGIGVRFKEITKDNQHRLRTLLVRELKEKKRSRWFFWKI